MATSKKGAGGTIYHYDDDGNYTGYSSPGVFGGYVDHDTRGNVTGHTSEIGDSLVRYDNDGNITEREIKGFSKSSYYHTDNSPHVADGCYVATCVYGSYDCPQVWTLRRFRDNTLGKSAFGRGFIRTYYAVSPTIVKWFGGTQWFKHIWRGVLDKMVHRLNSQGVENTPYQDKNWRR